MPQYGIGSQIARLSLVGGMRATFSMQLSLLLLLQHPSAFQNGKLR